jgi:hypothetical protein
VCPAHAPPCGFPIWLQTARFYKTQSFVSLGVSHRNIPGAGHVGMEAGRIVVLLTFGENGEEICEFLAPDA